MNKLYAVNLLIHLLVYTEWGRFDWVVTDNTMKQKPFLTFGVFELQLRYNVHFCTNIPVKL